MSTLNRRDFNLGATALALAGATGTAAAQGAAPVEGRDYVKLNTPVPVPAGGKIDVIEFFSWGCPHCYDFEPALEQWVKRLGPDVAFRRAPASFNAPFENYAKLFHALDAMGLAESLNKRLFAAIHVQRQRLDKDADIAAFVQANGGDGAKVVETMKSFGVATKLRQSKQLFEAYRIDGVPALGIHGRWFTSPALAGNGARSLAAADHLLAQVRKKA